jgi:glycosyltransferase involved in cell wall biosynthesis
VRGVQERFAGRIVLVIPAYNEADNIGRVLDGIPARVCGLETVALVVDDGSSDATAEQAREHGAEVVSHRVNRGQGAAMRTGYAIVADTAAEVVVAMDADGQHQAGEIARLVEPVLAGTADLANGSRILGEAERVHVTRDLGISFFARVLSLLTRSRVTDPANGFRAMRPAVLRSMVLEQDQFHNSEFLIEASRRGVRSIEVPVTVKQRLSGTSKKPANLRYGIGFANAVFRTWIRGRRPTFARVHR